MSTSFKVAQKYQVTNSQGNVETFFTVNGNPPTTHEKTILEELKNECGWPMFLYESHVEDAYGNVVQN
jgi:hypothetical protein